MKNAFKRILAVVVTAAILCGDVSAVFPPGNGVRAASAFQGTEQGFMTEDAWAVREEDEARTESEASAETETENKRRSESPTEIEKQSESPEKNMTETETEDESESEVWSEAETETEMEAEEASVKDLMMEAEVETERETEVQSEKTLELQKRVERAVKPDSPYLKNRSSADQMPHLSSHIAKKYFGTIPAGYNVRVYDIANDGKRLTVNADGAKKISKATGFGGRPMSGYSEDETHSAPYKLTGTEHPSATLPGCLKNEETGETYDLTVTLEAYKINSQATAEYLKESKVCLCRLYDKQQGVDERAGLGKSKVFRDKERGCAERELSGEVYGY